MAVHSRSIVCLNTILNHPSAQALDANERYYWVKNLVPPGGMSALEEAITSQCSEIIIALLNFLFPPSGLYTRNPYTFILTLPGLSLEHRIMAFDRINPPPKFVRLSYEGGGGVAHSSCSRLNLTMFREG